MADALECSCGAPKSPLAARCRECATDALRCWTRELVIDRMREWCRVTGSPPRAADWAGRWRGSGVGREGPWYWPVTTTVVSLFGGWNAALAAAGLPVLRPSGGRRRVSVR